MSYRDFPLVPKEKRPPLPKRFRQSLLARFDVCPRSGMLSLTHDIATHEQMRGSAFHETVHLATSQAVGQGEDRFPPELVKGLLHDVLHMHPEWVVPAGEMDGLRAMLWNWATHTRFTDFRASEQLMVMDVNGTLCSGTMDLIQGDIHMTVTDYKTSRHIPPQEEFERKFQLPFYAVLLADGKLACGVCNTHGKPTAEGCPDCDKGWLKPIGGRAQHFTLREVYPRYADEAGMATREITYTREQVLDHREYIASLVARTVARFETGDMPAVSGTHCSTCPAVSECPIPASLRRVQTFSPFERDASEIAEEWFFMDQDAKRVKASLREYAKQTGEPIPFGADLELSFVVIEQERDGKLTRSSRFDKRKRGK